MSEHQQQHPLKIYFQVWTLLFVFSALSYLVDWYQFQGYTRWALILFFMMFSLILFSVLTPWSPKTILNM